jgi:hypothetical protein
MNFAAICRLATVTIILLCGSVGGKDAIAGITGGPLVVWINLSPKPVEVDKRIQAYLGSGEGERDCGNFGMSLYMIRKPPEITAELAAAALVKKRPAALARVNKLLRKPFRDATEGMDGIVVYTEDPDPKLYSLTTGKTTVRELEIYPKELETGLCVILPPIVRKP